MKQHQFLIFSMIMILLSACVKDRLYIPENKPNTPVNPADSTVKLVINEFLASNNAVSVPGVSYFPDWIEIYNAGNTDVNLAGYSITDDLSVRDKYVIPSNSPLTIIKSKSYLLILADDSVALGPLHANFSLSKSGESIGLFSPQKTGMDSITYSAQTSDKSMGRLPNGTGTFQITTTPTPNAANY
jgi:hypothetical protein